MELSLSSSLDSKVVKLFLQVIGKENALTIKENQQELFVRSTSPQLEVAGQALSIIRYLNFSLNQGASSTLLTRNNAYESATINQWVSFVKVDLLQELENKSRKEALIKFLDKELSHSTFIAGNQLSIADLFIFVYVHSTVQTIHEQKKEFTYVNLCRYFNFIQDNLGSQTILPKIAVFEQVKEKEFTFVSRVAAAVAAQKQEKAAAVTAAQQPTDKKEESAKSAPQVTKEPKPKPAASAEDASLNVSILDIRVGKILSAKRHENAEKLYVEEITVGEEKPRTVCSGLVGKIPMESKVGSLCLLVCNLEPSNMRGVTSEAMILAATNDKEQTELVIVPEGAQIGERIAVDNFAGNALAKVNSKKLAKVLPHFKTNEKGEVCYQSAENVFRVPSNKLVCSSTFANAVVK